MLPEHFTPAPDKNSAMPAMVITCEHGGNRIPAPYRYLFRDCRALLESHRGFDPGALVMARALAGNFRAPLMAATVSRLVVDLNRSIGHRNLHMAVIRRLPAPFRQEIIDRYYLPYRVNVERLVTQGIARRGRLIHISSHSFVPSFNGVVRHADIGLLYDPARPDESTLCREWKSCLNVSAPDLKVRRNFPYRGSDDGLTSALRKKFAADTYVGIELELNQKNLSLRSRQWADLRMSIISSLHMALRRYNQ